MFKRFSKSSIFTAFFLALSLFVTSAHASERVSVSAVTSIYDGDTFRVNIEGWPDIVGHRMPVRVRNVDTPEMRGECQQEKQMARRAKQFTAAAVRNADSIVLENVERGKYFRIVANVMIDNRDLGEMLIREGLGRSYEGGRRDGWC